MNRGKLNNRGVALLLSIWVLAILMVIVLSFTRLARTDVTSTLSFRDGVKMKLIAEGGLERGLMEVLYRKRRKFSREKDAWKINGTAYRGKLGEGYYLVRVVLESGKLDINVGSTVLFKGLLTGLGVDEGKASDIADSLLDWKDRDDESRPGGAESEYYLSLGRPYTPGNAPLKAPEELLLVRGVDRGLLYGGPGRRGLIDFITVNGRATRINLNSAEKEVLMAVPGIDSAAAEDIIELREKREINQADFRNLFGADANRVSPYVSAYETKIYTVRSTGYLERQGGSYTVSATVVLEGDGGVRFLDYRSPSDI